MEHQTYCSVWSCYSSGTPEENVITCSICQQEFPADATAIDTLHEHLSLSHNMTREAKDKSFKVQKKRSSLETSSSHSQMESEGSQVADSLGSQGQEIHEKLSQVQLLLKFLYQTPLSLSQVLTDKHVRDEFVKNDEPFPDSEDELLAIICANYEEVKANLKDRIMALILGDRKFILLVEEWPEQTEDSKKVYLILRVYTHRKKSLNLGCLVFNITETPEVVLSGIQEKLQDFGISLHRDVAAIYTEGLDVVRDAIKMSSACEQFCYNRALHSAILKVLFREEKFNDDDGDDIIVPTYEHNLCSCELRTNLFNHAGNVKRIPSSHWERGLQSVMNIITLLTSPEYKEQFEITVNQGNFLYFPLFLACPFDWMSICEMLKTFFTMRVPIKRTLNHFQVGSMWDESRMRDAHKIYVILNEITKAMEDLSSKSANLFAADQVIMGLFSRFLTIQFPLTERLSTEITAQIEKRRNVALVSLLSVLEDHQYRGEIFGFKFSSIDIIYEMAALLYERLFGNGLLTGKIVENPTEPLPTHFEAILQSDDPVEPVPSTSKDFYKKCLIFSESPILGSRMVENEPDASGDAVSLSRAEFDQYMTTGIKGEKLKALHRVLISIEPSFTRSDVIGSTTPTIFYSPKNGFTVDLIDQINVIKNIGFND